MEALYIEDDPVQQRLMFLYMTGMDIKLHMADNGTDGLAIAHKVLPSFIITDLFVPGLDGITLLRVLKEDNRLQNIPVIVTTADLLIHDKFDVWSMGAAACLFKPVSRGKLEEILGQLFPNF
jgi:CheY-like chemotaxis protein